MVTLVWCFGAATIPAAIPPDPADRGRPAGAGGGPAVVRAVMAIDVRGNVTMRTSESTRMGVAQG